MNPKASELLAKQNIEKFFLGLDSKKVPAKKGAFIYSMEEFGKVMWNAALDWAIVNAKSLKFECDGQSDCEALIDKQSILNGKI